MNKLYKLIPVLALALVAGYFAFSSTPAAADDDARNAQILGNLKLKYPQLAELNVTLGDIKASAYEGLDEGSFTVSSPRGTQSQRFFVTTDNTTLFLIGDEVDVSKSKAEIDAEVAQREAAEAEKASMMQEELAASIEGLPARGNPDAPVTIVEFSDFQCPYCARGANTMEEVLEKYPNDVKLVFKHFPLGFHQWAKPAAIASHCAAEQSGDAFWTLHDKYFEAQKELTPQNVLAKSKEFLAGSGIDMAKWTACAEDTDSAEYKAAAAQVDADMAFGQKLGVTGTPGFFVNGQFLNGAQPLAAFEPLIEKVKQGS
jgi:protein-disulfide isomerase